MWSSVTLHIREQCQDGDRTSCELMVSTLL
jgi:hypothetical protein